MNQSLCWLCNRCYALPDPIGCGLHRRDPESRQVEQIPGVEISIKVLNRTHKGHGLTMKAWVVSKCPNFTMTARSAKDAAMISDNRARAAEQNRLKRLEGVG